EAPHRGIGVEPHDQRRAFGARRRQQRHVPLVEDVEHAVGEHHGAARGAAPAARALEGEDFPGGIPGRPRVPSAPDALVPFGVDLNRRTLCTPGKSTTNESWYWAWMVM